MCSGRTAPAGISYVDTRTCALPCGSRIGWPPELTIAEVTGLTSTRAFSFAWSGDMHKAGPMTSNRRFIFRSPVTPSGGASLMRDRPTRELGGAALPDDVAVVVAGYV